MRYLEMDEDGGDPVNTTVLRLRSSSLRWGQVPGVATISVMLDGKLNMLSKYVLSAAHRGTAGSTICCSREVLGELKAVRADLPLNLQEVLDRHRARPLVLPGGNHPESHRDGHGGGEGNQGGRRRAPPMIARARRWSTYLAGTASIQEARRCLT